MQKPGEIALYCYLSINNVRLILGVTVRSHSIRLTGPYLTNTFFSAMAYLDLSACSHARTQQYIIDPVKNTYVSKLESYSRVNTP